MPQLGRRFYKMSGSGNDFVFFDTRSEPPGALETPDLIQRVCARATGVGADGVVFLGKSDRADLSMVYYNSDGSRAAMCGNATLCAVNLGLELGALRSQACTLETDSGDLSARARDGLPEIDFAPVSRVDRNFSVIQPNPGELRIGYALAGVPHVVILCEDAETANVAERGADIRSRDRFNPAGTNVNFVSNAGGVWTLRTFERGVEAETLACGSGAVATGILLAEWGETKDRVSLVTRSGEPLEVRLKRDGGSWLAALRGEGRLVFTGQLREL
jgi:diaminopimelate epimerase